MKSIRVKNAFILLCGLGALPAAVLAQDSAFNGFSSSIALSQMQEANRNAMMGVRSPNSPDSAAQQSKIRAPMYDFSFSYSLAQRRKSVERFLGNVKRANPERGAKLEALFRQQDIFTVASAAIGRLGLKSNSLADVFAAWWMSAWAISLGDDQLRLSEDMVKAVRSQTIKSLSASYTLRTMTNAQKQEMAEALLLQLVIMESRANEAEQDATELKALKFEVLRAASNWGMDLTEVKLTRSGFIPAGGPTNRRQ